MVFWAGLCKLLSGTFEKSSCKEIELDNGTKGESRLL